MSADRIKIIKNFCHRFLTIDYTPKSFTEILDLSPKFLRGITDEEIQQLEKSKYSAIRDLTKIDDKNFGKIVEKTGMNSNQLQKWVLVANLVNRAWQKRSLYLKKETMKIAVLGLDSAGKTSMLEILEGASSLGDVIDLEPTTGVDVKKMESEKLNLTIWDFGGQVDHRNDYFKNPEEYFLQIDMIMYVIDMQNHDRFDESIEYFNHIFEIITFLKEHPYVLILLHKSDPDYVLDPEYQINFEYIQDALSSKLNEYQLAFEIIPTSIYNFYATEPDFASTFKKLFGKKKSQQKTTEEMLINMTEMLLKLSTTLMDEFKSLREFFIQNSNNNDIVLNAASNKKNVEKRSGYLAPPPPPPSALAANSIKIIPNSGHTSNIAQVRQNLMTELKEMFKLRRLSE